jgi:hypothetical protein
MKRRDDYLGGLVGIVIAITLFAIVSVIGSQVVGWLKTGLWPAFPISRALELNAGNWPRTDWVGLQKIIDLLLGVHVIIPIAIIGWLTGWGLYLFVERMTRPLPPSKH